MILVGDDGQPRVDDLGPLDFDDDTFWDAGRALELIGAAAVAKASEVYELMQRDAFGVRRAAIDTAAFISFFGIAEVDADDVEAACRAELEASRRG